VRRREGDGCPVTGALQLVGDKWTMLVVRDLWNGPQRTRELLASLHPISSRTLLIRLRDMERDRLIERHVRENNTRHVEYQLTPRGRLLFPFLDALWKIGQDLDCNECADRLERRGSYCELCPHKNDAASPTHADTSQHEPDDSIVLL
jgi:DNA-binding HxlR family transcriptional regulator